MRVERFSHDDGTHINLHAMLKMSNAQIARLTRLLLLNHYKGPPEGHIDHVYVPLDDGKPTVEMRIEIASPGGITATPKSALKLSPYLTYSDEKHSGLSRWDAAIDVITAHAEAIEREWGVILQWLPDVIKSVHHEHSFLEVTAARLNDLQEKVFELHDELQVERRVRMIQTGPGPGDEDLDLLDRPETVHLQLAFSEHSRALGLLFLEMHMLRQAQVDLNTRLECLERWAYQARPQRWMTSPSPPKYTTISKPESERVQDDELPF